MSQSTSLLADSLSICLVWTATVDLLLLNEPLEGHRIIERLCKDQVSQKSVKVAIVWFLFELKLSTVLVEEKKLG